MKVRDVIRLLSEDGWAQVSQSGSHRQFKHPSKAGRVTIAGKPGDEIAPGDIAEHRGTGRHQGETPMRTVAIVIEKAGRNYSAYAPEVPGCIATGSTPKEAEANMRSALELHLKGMAEDGLDFRSDEVVVRQVTLGTT